MSERSDILAIYAAALDAVEGKQAVLRALPEIIEQQWSMAEREKLQIVSIGKAADAMLQGALEVLAESNTGSLLITKYDHTSDALRNHQQVKVMESAHPVPDENSLRAGRELVKFIESEECPCVVLISGGASSLVELLDENWQLDDLQELTKWLLANAYSIDAINAIRRRVSCIKGGGLWQFLNNRKVICLMISDVPEDDPAIIGSGLLFPPQATESIPEDLPEQWKSRLPAAQTITAPDSFYWQIIASNAVAREAAAKKADALGYEVEIFPQLLEGKAEHKARLCVAEARKQRGKILIWGAETTVNLPENPGRGGRNQHFALAAAIEMASKGNSVLLAAGTDGTDGMTDDAGGIVDKQTVERGAAQGLNAKQCLKDADSGTFLDASGDLISTGVTGTNVMDLIIAWSESLP